MGLAYPRGLIDRALSLHMGIKVMVEGDGPPSLPPVVPHPSSRLNAVPARAVRAWRGGGGGRQQRRASPESHAVATRIVWVWGLSRFSI
jgi:hypothetical protein